MDLWRINLMKQEQHQLKFIAVMEVYDNNCVMLNDWVFAVFYAILLGLVSRKYQFINFFVCAVLVIVGFMRKN